MPNPVELLRNAPIIEAVLDFRTSLPVTTTMETLKRAADSVAGRYSEPEELHNIAVRGMLSPGRSTQPEVSDELLGYRLKSGDGTRLVQFRLDGFTFNHLPPYSNWESFSSEAWEHWQTYLQLAAPTAVTRIALRYINRHTFAPGERANDYIATPPSYSADVPGELTSFLFQAQLKLPGSENANATVIQFTEPPDTVSGGETYVLDIDASRTGSFPVSDTERFKNYFTELRNFKNEIFFNTVTPQAIALWK